MITVKTIYKPYLVYQVQIDLYVLSDLSFFVRSVYILSLLSTIILTLIRDYNRDYFSHD